MKFSKSWIYSVSLGAALVCIPNLSAAQNAASSGKSTGSNTNMSRKSGMDPRDNQGSLTASDDKFVKDAAEGGLAEVELGKLAAEKGASTDVKAFGQRMVTDHSKANDELKQIAGAKGVDLPTELSAKDKM